MDEVIAIVSGLAVGAALGLTGGGGSLFAVPLLVYGLQLTMAQAVPVSLLVVAGAAAVGAVDALARRLVLLRPTLVFCAGGMVAAPGGLWLGDLLSNELRLAAFALLTLGLAVRMWLSARHPKGEVVVRADLGTEQGGAMCRYAPDGRLRFTTRCATALVLTGAVTGLLSGLFGVGGGFLIVPALMFVTRMGAHQAVGTSLVVITAIGLTGALSAGPAVLAAGTAVWLFGAGAIAGMLGGRLVAHRVAALTLQRVFAAGLLLSGSAIGLQLLGGL